MRLSRPAALAALSFLIAAPVLAQTPAPSTTAKPSATSPAPATAPATKPAAPAATTVAPAQGTLIDINTASKDQLDALPQIGAARAEAIIKGRPYKAKSELLERKIIPVSAHKAIRHKIIAHQKS